MYTVGAKKVAFYRPPPPQKNDGGMNRLKIILFDSNIEHKLEFYI